MKSDGTMEHALGAWSALTHKWSRLLPPPWLLRTVSRAPSLCSCLSTAAALRTKCCRGSAGGGKVRVPPLPSIPSRASVRVWGKLGLNVEPKASQGPVKQ